MFRKYVYTDCRQFDNVQQLKEAIEAARASLSIDLLKKSKKS